MLPRGTLRDSRGAGRCALHGADRVLHLAGCALRVFCVVGCVADAVRAAQWCSEYSHGVLPSPPAVQVSWPKEGLRMAQLLLSCGVNDLGGVLMNESISTAVSPSRRVGYSEYSRGVH